MQSRFPIHPLLNPAREVIVFGKDPLVLKRLAPALPFGHFQVLVNPSTGKDLVQKRRCGVVIFDQELFENEGNDGGEHLLKIYKEVAELGAKTLFIFLFRPGGKLTTFFQGKVASELEINLSFHRDHISASQIQFVLNLF